MSEKYSGGPKLSAARASGGAARARMRVATVPAKKEPRAAVASAGPAWPFLRHLVAVDGGDGGRALAGEVDEDGGGRAAVLGAVVDAGEHDERRHRLEGEGDGQQHRDGGGRADAGQDADEGAEEDADEAVEEVDRGEGGLEAEGEVGEELHVRTGARGRPWGPESPRPKWKTARQSSVSAAAMAIARSGSVLPAGERAQEASAEDARRRGRGP